MRIIRQISLCSIISISQVWAAVTPAPLFQDGAVLQRGREVPVWGWATPGRQIVVSFANQTANTRADERGRWEVVLAPMDASAEGRVMMIREGDADALEIRDILVGEVWLASGQSNMEWNISRSRPEDRRDMEAAGEIPHLRLFNVPRLMSHTRQDTVDAKWQTANPETALRFSAISYFFGRELARELDVPVGMIHSSWGGSRIEPWWAEEGLDGIDELAEQRRARRQRSPGFPEFDEAFRNYVASTRAWADDALVELDAGGFPADPPQAPARLALGHNRETGTYQAMIHPLVPAALRGFLWYQGESNNGDGMLYTTKKRALIDGWRKQFKAPEAPFLFAQLAPFKYGEQRAGHLPEMWWAQQATLAIPHTGMAVINDIGDIDDIHPGNKSEVARRLLLWALADTYGRDDLVKSGPLFSGYQLVDGGVVVEFDHVGGGLVTRDGAPPSHFEIAGHDAVHHPAQAEISPDGSKILLTSPEVPTPRRARFAWSQVAEPNLMNRERLPAAAFYTHWPVDPDLGRNVAAGRPHQSSHPNPHRWDGGLTDGVWGNTHANCYATDSSPEFPKTVTIDLGEVRRPHAIFYGTPDIGSTKSVAVSLSEDGANFREVGRHDFPPGQATRAEARFEPADARYVRVSFLGNHPKVDDYNANFAFLSAIEVYER